MNSNFTATSAAWSREEKQHQEKIVKADSNFSPQEQATSLHEEADASQLLHNYSNTVPPTVLTTSQEQELEPDTDEIIDQQRPITTKVDTGMVGFNEVLAWQKKLEPQLPKQFWFIVLLYILTMFAGFVNNSFAPAIQAMALDFKVGVESITSIIVYYTIGNGIGQFIWGPLMDHFGRKKILLLCGYTGIILNLWLMNATTYTQLQEIRILQGLIYSGLGAVPSVILRDCYSAKHYVVYSSWISSLLVFTPVIAPIVGAWIFIFLGWQAIFGILSLIMLVALTAFNLQVPESLDPQKRQPLHFKRLFTNYTTIFSRPRSSWLLAISTLYAITTVIMPTMYPVIYIVDYQVHPVNFGWLVLINTVVMMLGLQLNSYLIHKGFNNCKVWLVAIICQAIASLLILYIVYQGVSLARVIISLVIVVFFTALIIGNMMSTFFIDYNNMLGTASSVVAIRLIVGGIVVALIAHIPSYKGATLLVILSLVIILSAILTVYYFIRFRPDQRIKINSDQAHTIKHK